MTSVIKLEWRPVALLSDHPPIDTSLTASEAAELQRLAENAEVLEIGSAYGFSAVAMALAGGLVHAVDPHTWLGSVGAMRQNLVAYRVAGNVFVDERDSYAVMPELWEVGRRFDLVWIDGDHEAPTVAHDVEWGRKLLKPTGTLACHDYDEATCPGVRQALDAWKPPPRLVDTLAIYGPGEW